MELINIHEEVFFMSMEHEELVKCSNCGSEDGFVIWQSLNATLNPEAKADIAYGASQRPGLRSKTAEMRS